MTSEMQFSDGKESHRYGSAEAHTLDQKPAADQAGEDDGSTSVEGNDDHLHDDQKPIAN